MDLVSDFLFKKISIMNKDIKFENYIKDEAKLNSKKQYIIEDSCYFDGNKDNFKRHYDANNNLKISLKDMILKRI